MLEWLLQFVVKLAPKPLKDIFYKKESMWRYCYYGAWTTLISFLAKMLGKFLLELAGYQITDSIPNLLNTTFSWIIAVTFAFVVNKKYVFMSKTNTTKELLFEIGTFYGARGVTYFLELGIMWLLTVYWQFNYTLISILSQFIILAINYVFSKLVTFRKGADNKQNADAAAANK